VARKTAAEVHLELSVHQKESEERWKTVFNKFVDVELEIKELQQKVQGGLTTLIILLVGLICSVLALLVESLIL
tara:strand:+ start:1599 stop:1820 length:222 start_codon:yes stop_codon:yes gene_type:complete